MFYVYLASVTYLTQAGADWLAILITLGLALYCVTGDLFNMCLCELNDWAFH